MPIELNHTIVHARDPLVSASLLAQLLGCPAPGRFGPFHTVALDNGVTLDFIEADTRSTTAGGEDAGQVQRVGGAEGHSLIG